MRKQIAVRPVTCENWDAFVHLFEAKGSPHFCWCMTYRAAGSVRQDAANQKTSMQALVSARTPVGVLAYEGDMPVGWCSIAPRETYVRLQKSRTMPRATPLDTPTWAVLCFFVVRSARGKGIARALLKGALGYARAQGAMVVEGYPFDSAGISATHRGHSSVFEAVGFRADGKRWSFVSD
jgi:GNAT superfamily N-acetyltransferase